MISKPTLERLPRYYRVLKDLLAQDQKVVSSSVLGQRLNIDGAQVRKDLTCVRFFGTAGVGYQVKPLLQVIGDILGLSNTKEAILVGVGNLGQAIVSYSNFADYGLKIVALFDVAPKKIGTAVGGIPVYHPSELVQITRRLRILMGIITVPAPVAVDVAEMMVQAGIRGIWNFAPVTLNVPEGVIVRDEDLAVGLSTVSHHLTKRMLENPLTP